MTMLRWLGVASGALIAMAVGSRVVGAARWRDLVRSHARQLERGRVGAQGGPPRSSTHFDAHEREGLPAPVARYFRAVLTDGQPMIAAASIEMAGRINMSATTEQWKPSTSHQRVVTRRPGFLWDARVGLWPGVPVHVEDSYIAGQGRVDGEALRVVDGEQAELRIRALRPRDPKAKKPHQATFLTS